MSAQHTPGPWKLTNDETYVRAGCYESGDTCPAICNVLPWSEERWPFLHRDEQRANARLIAAAPQLLEALCAIVNWCEHPSHGGSYNLPKPLQPYLLRAKAAISNARAA